ncbi:Uncharacterized protein TCM_034909 [Theobroma cacao]|uniref:Uncharacterized protein n=1 Tax=Theobroma cacao TaxID=3641 RepID=A0A061FGZ7_THECC|nr:Uncharacterized protein TCM_034909 [Theobroma cacao]
MRSESIPKALLETTSTMLLLFIRSSELSFTLERDKIDKDLVDDASFKDELSGLRNHEFSPEFGIVLDADHLDAIGAIGIAHCFSFGGNRNRVLHDPAIQPRSDLSKEWLGKGGPRKGTSSWRNSLKNFIRIGIGRLE